MNHCSLILNAMQWSFVITISSTTLLFFFRIRAVCTENKYLVGFFFLFWIAVVGVCIGGALERSLATNNLGPTHYCLSDPVNLIALITAISTVPMANDVLGFIAVTRQLIQNARVETTFKNGWRIAIFGKYLPAFSKALLKDSQAYFLYASVILYSEGVINFLLFRWLSGLQSPLVSSPQSHFTVQVCYKGTV